MLLPQSMNHFLLLALITTCIIHLCRSDKENESSQRFTELERLFLSVPNAASANRDLRFITSQPHVAGTMGDYVMAEYVADIMREAGIPQVSTFELDVLLNYPSQRPAVHLLSLDDKILYQAPLSEDLLDETSDTLWRNHTFHGYSPSGNVKAPLVFANYGRPTDFEALSKNGIDVQGTIVLMRYGKCFRGLKVRNAQRHGALGVLLYSDPADDGYGKGAVYPDGPWRPTHGVQRGSVQYNSACAGDPMRIDARYAARNMSLQSLCGIQSYQDWIPKIPSLPISHGDAEPLLAALGGPNARAIFPDFDGGIHNLNYTVGPSLESVVHLQVYNHESITKIPNVIGLIPGTLPPEQDMPVLLGNHRDAWVYGAADPNSGTASLLQVTRGLGALIKEKKWQPRRSIYLLSWSGEEYGLLGSTGWAELNADAIRRAVAYLNADTIVSGDHLKVSLTPALATLWEWVLDKVTSYDPVAVEHFVPFANGPHGDVRDANTNWMLNSQHPKEGILGSGSDYCVFLDHFGIPSLDFEFTKKEGTYGQYHSIYDSFAWMDEFGGADGVPGSSFDFMAFGAKIWGLLALHLADESVLPLNHVVQAEALIQYVDEIEKQQRGIDLAALRVQVVAYQRAALDLQSTCFSSKGNPTFQDTCNEKLGLVERQFLSEAGLPGRPWFKHILQAPGMDLGYAAEAFPGIQQALDDGDLVLAQQQVDVAAERVEKVASFLSVDNMVDS